MKLLLFIDHMESGGAARVTSILSQGLAQKGYEVLLAFNKQRPASYNYGQDVKTIDNYVERCGKSHIAGIILLIRRIIRYRHIIREAHPDVIIGIEPEPYLYARLAHLKRDIPVIAVDHTSFRRKQHWFTNWIRWNAYRWADKVSILSHVDAAIIGEQLPNKTVIHNPLPFEICTAKHKREKIVLCVGRPDAWEVKGIDRILRIWESIRTRHPQWQLWIAGISEKDPIPGVQFLGKVRDIKTLYQTAAIFAQPSRIEGFPMSLLEAASQGCACISFSLGGVADEIVTDKKSAFVIADNDEESFAQRLSALIEQEELRETFSQAAREQMKEFSKEKFIDTWEQFLS